MLAVATLSTAPICFWLLKSGPISLKGALPSFLSLGGSLRVVAFGAKMKRAIRRRQVEGESHSRNHFTGGRLAHHSVVLCDTDLTLAALAKDDAPAGAPSAPSSSASPSAAAPGLTVPRPNVTFAEAMKMAKFWALMVAAVSFFLYGGQLNLHLPSILVAEVGMGPTEAASIYSIYNVSAVIGKVLTAFVFTIPSLKRSFLIYIPFPLMFTFSHMLILNFDLSARLETGSVLAALSVTDSTLALSPSVSLRASATASARRSWLCSSRSSLGSSSSPSCSRRSTHVSYLATWVVCSSQAISRTSLVPIAPRC